MAKRKKTNSSSSELFPTLTKKVPHVVTYAIFIVLFLIAIKIVRKVTGVDF